MTSMDRMFLMVIAAGLIFSLYGTIFGCLLLWWISYETSDDSHNGLSRKEAQSEQWIAYRKAIDRRLNRIADRM